MKRAMEPRLVSRLETLSRPLAEAFERANNEKRRCALVLACEIAVSRAELCGSGVEAALEIVKDGRDDGGCRIELQALSEQFDDEYLRLWEQDDPSGIQRAQLLFRKARAAAALAIAQSASCEQLAEALCEAAFASDEPDAVAKSLEAALL
jgi:hypothetical protein